MWPTWLARNSGWRYAAAAASPATRREPAGLVRSRCRCAVRLDGGDALQAGSRGSLGEEDGGVDRRTRPAVRGDALLEEREDLLRAVGGEADDRPQLVERQREVPRASRHAVILPRSSCGKPLGETRDVVLDGRVDLQRLRPRKARAGEQVAVVSPSFAAPAVAPAVHEQAMRRLREVTGLVPVEYPTTRQLGASAEERARDLNAAFADPTIRAVLATVGGDDQITVVPHLDGDVVRADPKPFLGYSDNTNLLSWLFGQGVNGFYGGSTQVHLGPGPAVDAVHAASLRAALLDGGRLELTDPAESEDIGWDWNDPRALTEHGAREATEPWRWAGPRHTVTGPSWGGCIEVLQWILTADRFPGERTMLEGGVLLLESSEELIPAREFGWILRSLGERGLLEAVGAVVVARPPTSGFEDRPTPAERASRRAAQAETAIGVVSRYNPDAVVVVGVPFGHTRPQWVLPHGGEVTVDGAEQRVYADFA